MSSPKSKETPAQNIRRLERKIEEQRLKKERLNYMIDLSDKQYETAIRKKFSPKQSEGSSKKEE